MTRSSATSRLAPGGAMRMCRGRRWCWRLTACRGSAENPGKRRPDPKKLAHNQRVIGILRTVGKGEVVGSMPTGSTIFIEWPVRPWNLDMHDLRRRGCPFRQRNAGAYRDDRRPYLCLRSRRRHPRGHGRWRALVRLGSATAALSRPAQEIDDQARECATLFSCPSL